MRTSLVLNHSFIWDIQLLIRLILVNNSFPLMLFEEILKCTVFTVFVKSAKQDLEVVMPNSVTQTPVSKCLLWNFTLVSALGSANVTFPSSQTAPLNVSWRDRDIRAEALTLSLHACKWGKQRSAVILNWVWLYRSQLAGCRCCECARVASDWPGIICNSATYMLKPPWASFHNCLLTITEPHKGLI